ncbi:MAG TPA: hypothetical protein VGK93_13190, partial [Candidatus Eisenbacteria bacterium]
AIRDGDRVPGRAPDGDLGRVQRPNSVLISDVAGEEERHLESAPAPEVWTVRIRCMEPRL